MCGKNWAERFWRVSRIVSREGDGKLLDLITRRMKNTYLTVGSRDWPKGADDEAGIQVGIEGEKLETVFYVGLYLSEKSAGKN